MSVNQPGYYNEVVRKIQLSKNLKVFLKVFQTAKITFHLRNYWFFDLVLLLLVGLAFYALWLGAHPLLVPDEGRYSEVAREMIALHDYVTPHLNGTVLLDKPVFYYWLQVFAIKMFGLNEWALRFWPAIFGVFGGLLTYAAARILFDRRTGILSAIILMTSPLYFGLAHYANLDIEVSTFITGALFSFIVAMQSPPSLRKTGFLLAAYVFSGLALLTKGLIGIVFPMMIIAAWIICLQRWRTLKEMHLAGGLAIVFLIAAPWYILAQHANPGFLQYFFVGQQFTRFLSKNFNNQQYFWFYIPVLLIGFFPWVIFLPQILVQKVRKVWDDARNHQVELFLLLWPLLIFIFFSLPHSKTIGYIVPVMPPLAVLIGNSFSRVWDLSKMSRWFIVCAGVIGIVLIAITASIPYLNLTSVKPLAVLANKYLQPTDEVVTFYHYYYDLPVYLQRQVSVVSNWQTPHVVNSDTWQHELWQGSHGKSATIVLLDERAFLQDWQSGKRVFVFTNAANLATLRHLVGNKLFFLGQYHNVVLFTNFPLTMG